VGECFFWYWRTRVVADQGPLNGCVCVCVRFFSFAQLLAAAMLHLVQDRELGLSPPRQLVRCETARRLLTLELSKYQDIEPIHSSTVNSLDLDPIEQR